VRDRIPDIIRSSGRIPKVKVLTPTEYQHALRVKLGEEAAEVGTAVTREELLTELADVQEVVDALLAANKMTFDELQAIQHRRRCDRGGFSLRQWLDIALGLQ
ncbi:MAG: phosphoribosyl-ATP pyrophosphohydrolase, partial [Chloroflexi bacterium]|nr:phosphoribosyl-ATP pyrophosphohydrolase [Chloroflexota bacterium]